MLAYTFNTGFHMHTCMYKCTHMPVHTHTHTKKILNYYTFLNFTRSALITFETYELKKKPCVPGQKLMSLHRGSVLAPLLAIHCGSDLCLHVCMANF